MGGEDQGVCASHAVIAEATKSMGAKLDIIISRLGDGQTNFATLELRVKWLERIVYGAVALILMAVCGGVLALLLKASPHA